MRHIWDEKTRKDTKSIFNSYFTPHDTLANNKETKLKLYLVQKEMIRYYLPKMDMGTKERAKRTLKAIDFYIDLINNADLLKSTKFII